MSVNITSYQAYFRQLAMEHKDLLHTAQSETADGFPGSKHFARWSVDELISGLRTKVGFPALLLENYEVATQEKNKYDIAATHTGAFTILDHAEPGNYTSEVAAFEKTERILYQILQRIWQDHYGLDKDRCSTPFRDFYFSMDIVSVGPIMNNEFGWRCEFPFTPKLAVSITTPPAAGVFIAT